MKMFAMLRDLFVGVDPTESRDNWWKVEFCKTTLEKFPVKDDGWSGRASCVVRSIQIVAALCTARACETACK